MSDAFLHCPPSYFLGQGLSPNWQPSNWTRLTCQQVPGGLLSWSSQSYDYKDRPPHQLVFIIPELWLQGQATTLAAQVLMLARQTLNPLRLLPSTGFFIAYAFPLWRSKVLSVLHFAGNSQLLLLQRQVWLYSVKPILEDKSSYMFLFCHCLIFFKSLLPSTTHLSPWRTMIWYWSPNNMKCVKMGLALGCSIELVLNV